jgi:hypothetical protein
MVFRISGKVWHSTLDFRVRKIQVGEELRLHTVARLATELWCRHVFHRPISELDSYSRFRKVVTPKNHANLCSAAFRSAAASPKPCGMRPLSEIDAQRNQPETKKENSWQNQEHNNAPLRVVDAPPNLQG